MQLELQCFLPGFLGQKEFRFLQYLLSVKSLNTSYIQTNTRAITTPEAPQEKQPQFLQLQNSSLQINQEVGSDW